jgi:hypothetical protein
MRGRRRLGAKAVGSMGRDARSGSLQRMVRRFRLLEHTGDGGDSVRSKKRR